MGKFFSVQFSAVTVSTAAQDLFEIVAGTKPLRLVEVVFSQNSDYGDAQAEGLTVQIKRGIGSTTGSGGSTPTAAPHRAGDTAFDGTCKANNTSQATAGSGSLTVLRSECFNVQGGYQYLQPSIYQPGGDDERPHYYFRTGETCVVSLSAPADALTASGTLVFEVIG